MGSGCAERLLDAGGMVVRSPEKDATAPMSFWSAANGVVTPTQLTSVAALLGVSIEQPQNGRFRLRAMTVDMSVLALVPTRQYVAANPTDGTLVLIDSASDANGWWMFHDAGVGADRHAGWPVSIWSASDASTSTPWTAVNGAGRLTNTADPADAYVWILSPASLVLPPGAVTTDPALTAGCILWLDAMDNRYVTSDVYGRTLAVEGDVVQLWLDRSPAQNHVAAVAAAVYTRSTAANQRPALTGPLAYRLTRPLLPHGSTAEAGATLFIVCQGEPGKASISPLTLYTENIYSWLPYADGSVYEVLGCGSARISAYMDATSKPFLYTVVADAAAGQTTVYHNAVAKASGVYAPNTLSQFAAGVGFMHTVPQNRFYGSLSEILLFERPLGGRTIAKGTVQLYARESSKPRLSDVTSNLMKKWGIAVTPVNTGPVRLHI